MAEDADVIVVGGGLAGLVAACEIADAGKRVIVVDQEQSAERPERLAAEVLFTFLIDHDDAFACIGDLGGGNQPRQSAAYHDYVRVIRHAIHPRPVPD